MDFEFEKNGKHLTAVDAGWKESGYSVYEIINDEDGTVIDTVMVHPLDDIAHAVDEWLKG
jgi:hypothetical protein